MTDHKAKAEAHLKRAGYATGGGVNARLRNVAQDKAAVASPPQRARGGATKKGHSTHVNVIVAPQGGGQRPVPVPVPVGGPPGGGMPPPGLARPPMAGPPGMPPGAPPGGPPMGMRPPGAMKRGGAVHMDAGAGGGEGRIEKAEAYGKGGTKVRIAAMAPSLGRGKR